MIPVIITASKETLTTILERLEDDYWFTVTEEIQNVRDQIQKQLDESKDNVCPLLLKKNY